jgi:hypothetical protein
VRRRRRFTEGGVRNHSGYPSQAGAACGIGGGWLLFIVRLLKVRILKARNILALFAADGIFSAANSNDSGILVIVVSIARPRISPWSLHSASLCQQSGSALLDDGRHADAMLRVQ